MGRDSNTHTISLPIRSMETADFLITERLHPSNWKLLDHAHDSMILGIIYQGLCKETISKRTQECGPLSLQLLPPGETHSYEFGKSEVRCLTIEVKPQTLEAIGKFTKIPDHPLYVAGGMFAPLMTKLYGEFHSGDDTSLLTVEGLIFETLGNATRTTRSFASPVAPRWLSQARDFIHDNRTKGVSLVGAANAVGVTPAHLARTFRKHYHCSVGEYVSQLRLEHAILQLTYSNKSLAEIAVEAGFYDQSHMAHAFRLNVGMTPAECRAQLNHGATKKSGFSKTQ